MDVHAAYGSVMALPTKLNPSTYEWVRYLPEPCPRCGNMLESEHCKGVCKVCGYFHDCSDF